VLKGSDHVIQIVNDPVLEMWGRTYENVIDLPIGKALPEIVEQGFIELLDNVYHTATPYLADEQPVDIVRNGILQKIYLNFMYQPFLNPQQQIDGVIVVAIDVTEQVKSRKIVEEAESNLKNAIDLADLGTWNIDLQTQFADYSPRVAEWWGLSEEGDTLNKIIDCIHPEDRERASNNIARAIKERGYYEAEYRLVHAITKQERYIQANGKVFYDDTDRPIRLSGVVADVTLFKMTQQELKRQVDLRTAALVELNKDLSISNDNLKQFAYVASHDLQEPLRKIQTFSEMVKDHLSDGTYVSNYLSKIDSAAARMSALIKDVLVFSQITTDQKVQGEVDLARVLEEVKTDFELLIEQKQASIFTTSLPKVTGNKFHFRQLFHNLIGNSLKFCEKSPVIEILGSLTDGHEIPINLKKANRYHRLEFKDNGIGFEPEYAEQIFGLFARLHNRKDFGGTGIGLALCKKIVESYGGFIFAKSKKGQGASFIILLPLESF
jgi:PAS domain S-box-containing protein